VASIDGETDDAPATALEAGNADPCGFETAAFSICCSISSSFEEDP